MAGLIDRVLMKFAMIESDSQFEEQLAVILPPVLLKFSNPTPAVHAHLLTLLSHFNTMLKSRPGIQIPAEKLLTQISAPDTPDTVKTFTAVYIEMGFTRLPLQSQVGLLPALFKSLSGRPDEIQCKLLRCALPAFRHFRFPPDAAESTLRGLIGLQDDAALDCFLDFSLGVLMLNNAASQPSRPPASQLPITPAQQLQAAATQNAPEKPIQPPPGLSWAQLRRVVGEAGAAPTLDSREKVIDAKIGILRIMSTPKLLTDDKIIAHLIVASADSDHEVVDAADSELRRRVNAVNIELPVVVQMLFRLALGDYAVSGVKTADEHKQTPAGSKLLAVILGFLIRSQAAARTLPASTREL